MKTTKRTIILLLAIFVLLPGSYAPADAAGGKDAAKKTSEIKGYEGQFDLFNTNRKSRSFLTDSVQPIAQKKEYGEIFDLYNTKQSWALLAGSEKPTTKSTQGQSLAEQATDPTAPLVQFSLQNIFIPDSFDSSGYSNSAQIQPVIPWKAGGQPMITRPTIPFILTPDPDGPISETSGLGDIQLLHLFIIKKDWGNVAVGFNAVFPSATDGRLGSGKWQAGPAVAAIYTKIPKWQLGALVYNNWSYATQRSGKENVNKMFVQWIANYHYKPGWYVGVGDLAWSFNWRNGKQDIPLSIKWGHVTKICNQPVNIYVEPFYRTSHEGPSGEYGVKFNLTLLFP
jgi:hypothetical protein